MFLAKDVAEWIDYSKTSQGYYNVSKMLMTIDEEEKVTITNSNNGGSKLYLTEDGMYEVLMQSRKPIAKQYKKQVKEILKSVRKNGAYMTDNVLEQAVANPDFMIGLLTNLKVEQEARKLSEKERSIAEAKVVELEPRAEQYDNYMDSIRELLSTGKLRLNALGAIIVLLPYLDDDGYLKYRTMKDKPYINRNNMMKILRLSVPTFERVLRSLKEVGILQVEGEKNKKSIIINPIFFRRNKELDGEIEFKDLEICFKNASKKV